MEMGLLILVPHELNQWVGIQPGEGSRISGAGLQDNYQGWPQSHPIGSIWNFNYFLQKTQLGNE